MIDRPEFTPPSELPDFTERLTFQQPSPESVDRLLEHGVVVIDSVIEPEQLATMREAVDTIFYGTLHRRLFYRALEELPSAKARDWARGRHSRTSQINPQNMPEMLSGMNPAIDGILGLDRKFFEDERIRNMYPGDYSLNIADVSRAKPPQKAFVPHQDSDGVTRLGYALQGTRTLWTIYGGHPPSRRKSDYTFIANPGSVVVLTERTGPQSGNYILGQGFAHFRENGSEVHGGDNLTEEIRHRVGVFYREAGPVPNTKINPFIGRIARRFF